MKAVFKLNSEKLQFNHNVLGQREKVNKKEIKKLEKNKRKAEKKNKNRVGICMQIVYAFLDILVNIWYSFLFNIYILVYNYFGGMLVLFI